MVGYPAHIFERFTERARQVIVLAQDEARILKHNYIGTEHILLGLLREAESLAAFVLGSLDITVEQVRLEVVAIVGSGEEVTSGQIPFTPRAKKVLELALREALSLDHNYIGTEHILLGLARENEGVATRILLDCGADSETIRNEVIRMLSGPGGRRWEPSEVGPRRVLEQLEKISSPSVLVEGANWLVGVVAREIDEQLGRKADAGDLLVTLAHVTDGLAARTLARLGVDADSLLRAVEEARREDKQAGFRAPPELLAEIERVREEKESKIEAKEFNEAAVLRDTERRLRVEVQEQERRGLKGTLAEVRARLGLADA